MKNFFVLALLSYALSPVERILADDAQHSRASGTSAPIVWVTITPAEFPGAINNPLKGFRAYKKGGYGLLERKYIKWSEIEVCAEDSVERIIAHTTRITEAKGKRFEDLNIKLVPRVYLDWDGSSGKQYWPPDLHTFDYDSPAFQERLKRLIAKLGQAWDDDPRIFAVQMGLIGYWGEHHNPAPSAEQRRLLVEAFQKAFKNKPVLVRHNDAEFMQAGFGIYYDTFANLSREPPAGPKDQFPWQATNIYRDLWKRAPVEGEVEYNWQQQRESAKPEATFGRTPDETMKVPAYRRYMMDKIRRYHTSYLGWITNYDDSNPEVLAGAAELQKSLWLPFRTRVRQLSACRKAWKRAGREAVCAQHGQRTLLPRLARGRRTARSRDAKTGLVGSAERCGYSHVAAWRGLGQRGLCLSTPACAASK